MVVHLKAEFLVKGLWHQSQQITEANTPDN
jgi:hypothetical protein